MIGNTYRLTRPLLAIQSIDGQHQALTIPSDVLITVEAGPLNGFRLVEAQHQGKLIYMFTQDLREYAELVGEAPAA